VRRRAVKRALAVWCEAQIRLVAAEEIAGAIRRSVPMPAHYCPSGCVGCARWEQAQADADLAVELGGLGGAR
jgi:hypothetical protein